MYGLVNQAIADLITNGWDDETWTAIRVRANVEHQRFFAGEQYDDAVTYALVEAAAEVLQLRPDEVLEAFGRHWILFTGARGWGPTIDAAGNTVREVMHNLDAMHARVSVAMAEATMPNFRMVTEDEDSFVVEYLSPRVGLAPMVKGLLEGLGERLEDPHTAVEVSAGTSGDLSRHEFRLTRRTFVTQPN